MPKRSPAHHEAFFFSEDRLVLRATHIQQCRTHREPEIHCDAALQAPRRKVLANPVDVTALSYTQQALATREPPWRRGNVALATQVLKRLTTCHPEWRCCSIYDILLIVALEETATIQQQLIGPIGIAPARKGKPQKSDPRSITLMYLSNSPHSTTLKY